MNDPIAFFITIATYGTWLPGDQRGWVEYHKGWQLPDPVRELEAAAKMSENSKILTCISVDSYIDKSARHANIGIGFVTPSIVEPIICI